MGLHPLVLLSVVVGAIAVLLSLDTFEDIRNLFLSNSAKISQYLTLHSSDATTGSKYGRIFTKAELSRYDGEDTSPGLYLAILGKVYDVSKGQKHYGPGGGYHFFAGRDATAAFVTGKFEGEGLTDDVSNLSPEDMIGIEEWMTFYEKDYTYVGKLEGRYYDRHGNATTELLIAQEKIHEGHQVKKVESDDKTLYPMCNSAWTQKDGATVWCTNKSGGKQRDWTGVPRKYYKLGSSEYRCACIRTTGPPGDDPTSALSSGDLLNPMFKPYKNCHEHAITCKVVDD